MKNSIQKIVFDADDEVQCEWPLNFNRERKLNRVRNIQPIVEKILDCHLELDDSSEDASYFASLALWEYVPPDPKLYTAPGVERAGMSYALIHISFSCFGNLATIGSSGDPKDQFSIEKINRIVQVLNDNGFVFISEKDLFEKYHGTNPHFSGSTWGERYFPYL
jgi:hypothetical protein